MQRWIGEQNKFSRSILDSVPARELLISDRLKDLYSARSVSYYNFYQRKMFFALKSQPSRNQPVLVMLNSPDDLASEQVILDPNVLNPRGTTAIGFLCAFT